MVQFLLYKIRIGNKEIIRIMLVFYKFPDSDDKVELVFSLINLQLTRV